MSFISDKGQGLGRKSFENKRLGNKCLQNKVAPHVGGMQLD